MFYKEKGFYISLICGIVCLVAFGAICMNVFTEHEEEANNLPMVQETPMPTTEPVAQVTMEPPAKQVTSEHVKSEVEKETPEPKVTPTMKKVSPEEKLHFDQETGLLWPVQGDILIEYSADKVVYFPTLSQYKTNPALIISSKIGEEVKASAAGVVKQIEKNDETGTTVTMAIGDDFKVIYGQLKDVTVAKGDQVNEGEVIGKIAKPTKYYSVEGANLFYQVKQKGDTINPLVLLR